MRIIRRVTGSTGPSPESRRRGGTLILQEAGPAPDRVMQPFETVYVDSMVVACNGGGGPLGHPKVYLNLAGDGRIECPYCSRLFVHEAHRTGEGHVVEAPSGIGPGTARPADRPPPGAPAKP
jgi:uncharacterized Zn-finger protein